MLQKQTKLTGNSLIKMLVIYGAAAAILLYPLRTKAFEYDVDIEGHKTMDFVCITISGVDSGLVDPVMKLPAYRSCKTCTIIDKDKFEKFKNSSAGKSELVKTAINNYKNIKNENCQSRKN